MTLNPSVTSQGHSYLHTPCAIAISLETDAAAPTELCLTDNGVYVGRVPSGTTVRELRPPCPATVVWQKLSRVNRFKKHYSTRSPCDAHVTLPVTLNLVSPREKQQESLLTVHRFPLVGREWE